MASNSRVPVQIGPALKTGVNAVTVVSSQIADVGVKTTGNVPTVISSKLGNINIPLPPGVARKVFRVPKHIVQDPVLFEKYKVCQSSDHFDFSVLNWLKFDRCNHNLFNHLQEDVRKGRIRPDATSEA